MRRTSRTTRRCTRKLSAGATGYDVICPSDYMVHVLIMAGLVTPLDMSLIPNFKNVDPKFQKPTFDPETDGKKYSVPYQWGTTGHRGPHRQGGGDGHELADDVGPASQGPDHHGERDAGDHRRGAEAAGLLPQLAPPRTSSTEAGDKLIEQKPLIAAYDSNNMKRNMIRGTPLVHAWNADALLVMDEIGQDKLLYVLPNGRHVTCKPRTAALGLQPTIRAVVCQVDVLVRRALH